jgi:hypothetical protein
MSLAITQTLSKDSATDVDTNTVVYTARSQDAGRSEFGVSGVTPPADQTLIVSHETRKNGDTGHLVSLRRTVVDALLVPQTLVVNLTIVRPPSVAITNAIVLEEVNRIIDFLIEGGANANVTAVLNNEV